MEVVHADDSSSQFPQYFGEVTLWTGIATAAFGTLAPRPVRLALGLSGGVLGLMSAAGLSYVSPFFSGLITLKASGIPPSERKYDAKYGDRKDYQEWKKNTPKVIPKLW
jgi:steroid 5-alpha reductase family enzyme